MTNTNKFSMEDLRGDINFKNMKGIKHYDPCSECKHADFSNYESMTCKLSIEYNSSEECRQFQKIDFIVTKGTSNIITGEFTQFI